MDTYRKEIEKMLMSLTKKQRLLFGVLTCERLYPNYLYFQNNYNWGNSEALLKGINVIYQYLMKDELFSKDEIQELIQEVDAATPDTETFSEIFVSFALDACTSLYSSLSYILDPRLEYIVDVAIYARDTVDMFIQERDDINSNDEDLENRISEDPLMTIEKNRQMEVINKLLLSKTTPFNDKLILELRTKAPIINIELLHN